MLVRLVRKSWSLIKEESTFIDWQRAKVQETPDEVSYFAPCLSLWCIINPGRPRT